MSQLTLSIKSEQNKAEIRDIIKNIKEEGFSNERLMNIRAKNIERLKAYPKLTLQGVQNVNAAIDYLLAT